VTSSEIIAALKEQNFNAKTVINILNRKKEQQPLFKVELEPSSQKNNTELPATEQCQILPLPVY